MSSDTSKDPVIQVNQAKRHYTTRAGTVKALDGVDLQVLPGEFLAIAGPSGSGKSTLLNLIGALDTPTDGEVIVDGQNLSGMKEGDLAKLRRDRIGFVFQAYNLIPVLSALENVEYVMQLQGEPVAKRREAATKILRDVGLGDMLDRRPQQRVAVARAIAANPAIVLADEPTANLDSTTGVQLLEMMQHLNKEHGTTFVFSTHDPEVMERASRLVRLRDGKIESEEKRS
jgi:putative ABC transport system ATP-binding protein